MALAVRSVYPDPLSHTVPCCSSSAQYMRWPLPFSIASSDASAGRSIGAFAMPSSKDVSPSCRTSRSCGSSGSSCSPMQRRRALAPRGFDLIVSPKFLTFLILPFYNRPTKVRNIRQQKCYNDLRKRRRSLAWHEQRASHLGSFAPDSAQNRPARRNYSGFGFRTVLSAQNAAVRNTTRFAGGTCSSAAPAGIKRPSRLGRSCTAHICR